NVAALGADTFAAAVPFATGLGAAVRAAKAAEHAASAARGARPSRGSRSAAPGAGSSAARGGVYVLREDGTGAVVRTGQTSNLAKRRSDHANARATRRYSFEAVFRTDNYAERRGLEQLLHDAFYEEAFLNKERAVGLRNKNLPTYL